MYCVAHMRNGSTVSFWPMPPRTPFCFAYRCLRVLTIQPCCVPGPSTKGHCSYCWPVLPDAPVILVCSQKFTMHHACVMLRWPQMARLALHLEACACLRLCATALCAMDIDRWDVGSISDALDLLDSQLLLPPAAGSTYTMLSAPGSSPASCGTGARPEKGANPGSSCRRDADVASADGHRTGPIPSSGQQTQPPVAGGRSRGRGAVKELVQLQEQLVLRLVQWLGRTARVANDPELLHAFCCLSGAAVRHWAASDQLRADSENTVVWLLHAWVCAGAQRAQALLMPTQATGSTARPSPSPPGLQAQLQEAHVAPQQQRQSQGPQPQNQLQQHLQQFYQQAAAAAAFVRLPLLSPVYAQAVLQLPWFGPKVPALYAALLHRRTLDSIAARLVDVEGWPPGWVSRTPRAGLPAVPAPPPATSTGKTGDTGHKPSQDQQDIAAGGAQAGAGVGADAGKARSGADDEGTSAGLAGQRGARPVLELTVTREELAAALDRVTSTRSGSTGRLERGRSGQQQGVPVQGRSQDTVPPAQAAMQGQEVSQLLLHHVSACAGRELHMAAGCCHMM